MDSEIDVYLKNLSQKKEFKINKFVFYEGLLFSKPVIITKSGVGKVFAAITAQKLIDTYDLRAVIMTGVGGALKENLKIGDVVVGKDSMQHDMDVTVLGFTRGEIPYLNEKIFVSDKHLVKLALTTHASDHRILEGRILSGDQFPNEKQTRAMEYLFGELAGDVLEMEGAAVGQVCTIDMFQNKRIYSF